VTTNRDADINPGAVVVVHCAGTNRFGRPCLHRVPKPGDTCGLCRGPVTDPFAAPEPAPTPAEAIPDAPATDWTSATGLTQRLAPLAERDERLQRLVEIGFRLVANSKAPGTQASYSKHWETYLAFCETYGLSTETPAAPEAVALFVSYLADRGNLRDAGSPLSHGYLTQAIAAIRQFHLTKGLPSPTDDPIVRDMLEGYAKVFGVATQGRQPLGLAQLGDITVNLSSPNPTTARNRALCLLACHPDLRFSLGQIVRLDGEHLVVPDDVAAPIVALVQRHRSRHLTPIEIPYDGTAGCPTTALRELGPRRWGPVFRKDNNERLTREGVRRIIVTSVTATGLPPQPDTTIPALDAGQRTQLSHHLQVDATLSLRARAVLLTGYWGAFRGAELSALRWGHAKHVERGIEWHTPKAKNDQLGQGRTTGVPLVDDPFLCPVQAVNDWRTRLEALTGRVVAARDYVFCALNRGQPDPTQPLSRAALSDLVAAVAQATGLGTGYTTHSLRAGFVTDAIDAGARPEQIAHHGRWTNTKSLAIYYRRRELWAPANPALQIAHTLTNPRHP
jgi:integrase